MLVWGENDRTVTSAPALQEALPDAEVLVSLVPEQLIDFAFNGRVAGPTGSRHSVHVPWEMYRCAGDDEWIAICVNVTSFASFAEALGEPHLAGDARFSDALTRLEHRSELDAIVAAWTAAQPARWSPVSYKPPVSPICWTIHSLVAAVSLSPSSIQMPGSIPILVHRFATVRALPS
jgi:hypothetical protein